MTRSMPTSAATAWATVCVVAGEQHRVRARGRAAGRSLRALVGLTRSATVSRPRTSPSQATTTAVLPLAAASAAARRERRAGAAPSRASSARARRGPRAPRRRPTRPARACLERLDGGQRPDLAPRRRVRSAWAIGCSEACSSAPARRRRSARSTPRVDGHVDERHAAGRDGAGLVEHDGVDRAGRLEHLGSRDQDAELRAAAGADEQRGRCGKSERTRAGDDEHRHGGGERHRRRSAPSEQPPDQRHEGDHQHDRHEDARDPVGEALHLGLARLRLLDQPRHLGELGVGAHAGGAHDQAPAHVDRGADHGIAGRDLDGHGLARDDRRRRPPRCPTTTTPSVAIFSPGRTTNWSPTRRSPIGMRISTVPAGVAAQHRDVLRPELEQCAQRGAGAALGAHLEVAAGEHEHRDARGDLEVDVAGAVAGRDRPLEAVRHAGHARRARRTARTATTGTRPRRRWR